MLRYRGTYSGIYSGSLLSEVLVSFLQAIHPISNRKLRNLCYNKPKCCAMRGCSVALDMPVGLGMTFKVGEHLG
jgi:hypothetical protein